MSGIDLSGLNASQREIVTTLDEPLFVEAGAGSGKTLTLTQRIVWALSPGSGANGAPYLDDISQMLVITFTNAAAREIRERVRSTLRAAGLAEQALKVDSAWISTIHGMCSRILRRHALELGLDPEFTVVSGNDADAFERQALDEVVGQAFREARPGSALRAAFDEYGLGEGGPGSWTGTLGVVQGIRAAAGSVVGGYASLSFPEADDVSEAMGRLAQDVGSLSGLRLPEKARDQVMPALEALEEFLGQAPGKRTPDGAIAVLDGIKLPARVSREATEALRAAKATLAETRAAVLLAKARPWADALVGLAQGVDARVRELEREHSVISNDELIGRAYEAVTKHESIARDYAGRFRLVMVDEFQDTDERQLELISILAGEDARHLTTVGDAQQSIYRFRGADVGVFRGRGRSLAEERHKRLDVNYRSHADVLALVERACGGERGVLAGFMHLDPFPGRADHYLARDLPRIDLEVTVGQGMGGRVGAPQAAVAAAALADRLREYHEHGERAGDMVLLLGATTHAALYIDAIRARGMSCVATGGSTFTAAPEVDVMAKLLHTLANPHDTRSGLFPLLASEMFELDANDLVQLGTGPQAKVDAPTSRRIDVGLERMEFYGDLAQSPRLRAAHDVLAHARASLAHLPVADVCLQAVRESGWLERLEAAGAPGRAREANVLAAVRYIRDLTEEMGLGPARAAVEFDTWLRVSKVPPASLSGGEMDAVRVMTIHASKGLQFPVTAVAECWNRQPERGKLRYRAEGGTCTCVLSPDEVPSKLDGLEPVEEPSGAGEWWRYLRERNEADDAAERARLLYVALTRAQEALVVGCNVSASKSKGFGPDLAVGFLDAVVPELGLAEASAPEPGEFRFAYGGSEPGRARVIRVEKAKTLCTADSAGAFPEVDGELPEDLGSVIAPGAADEGGCGPAGFALYDAADDSSRDLVTSWDARPGTYSFSSAHAEMEEAFGSQAQAVSATPAPRPAELEAEQQGAPATDDEDRATSFGSAFHELAQAMVESGVDALPEARIAATERVWGLSARNGERLRSALARWAGSRLRAEVLSHGTVRAEVPFFVRAESAYGRYVEGAIDLLATDAGSDAALLVDYKTGDRGLAPEQIRARHEMQANFYASVLMGQGFATVECRFACVELEDPGAPGEPLVVSYAFDGTHPPRI